MTTLLTHCAAQIDGRIAGMAAPGDEAMFSAIDHATPAYTRNTGAWFAAHDGLPAIDLTCYAVWNSRYLGLFCPTAITPLHVITAKHVRLLVGDTLRFVTADSTIITRTITAVLDPEPGIYPTSKDFWLCKLDSALPASITPAKILPTDWADYADFSNASYIAGNALPCLTVKNTTKAAVVSEVAIFWRDSLALDIAISDATRIAFHENTIVGDSSSPSFLLVNGEAVLLLNAWFGGPTGCFVSFYAAGINTGLATLGGGYSAEAVSLAEFAPLPDPIVPPEEPLEGAPLVADKYTFAAGDILDPANWDGDPAALPVAGQSAGLKHNMTLANGATFPVAGTLLSLDLLADVNGLLTITGGSGATVIKATTVTNIQKLVDTAATQLTVLCDAASGTAWTCNGADTVIGVAGVSGNLALASAAHALQVATTKKLTVGLEVKGEATGSSQNGIRLVGSGTLIANSGIANSALQRALVVPAAATLTITTTMVATSAGSGAASDGALLSGTVSIANLTGTAGPTSEATGVLSIGCTFVGNIIGIGGTTDGVSLQAATTVTGNVLGYAAGADEEPSVSGVYIDVDCILYGDILLTSHKSSARITLTPGATWYSDAVNGYPGRIVAASGYNTIKDAAGTEFCPTANVAAAANVANTVPRWTGATGADVGTYQTTAVTQAAQQATDAGVVTAAVLNTASGAPTVALGASTATIDAATWETARNADPGVGNVRSGTTYKSKATATKTGTLDIAADNPPAGDVEYGVPGAAGGATGLLWIDR